MSNLNDLGKVITSDVLVVGHGLAGLAAALTVKEDHPGLDVVTVDKCFPGYGGKANKGGGHAAFIPEGDEETYVEYHTENLGDYLNDQDMLRIYANATQKTMDRWESWGVKFKLSREDSLNAHAIIPWKVTLVDLDVMLPMAGPQARCGEPRQDHHHRSAHRGRQGGGRLRHQPAHGRVLHLQGQGGDPGQR